MEQLRKPLETMTLRLFLAARDMTSKAGEQGNVVICPFAVTSAVTMLYYASEGTSANRQMENILRFEDMFDGRAEAKMVLMAFRCATKILTKIKEMESRHGAADNKARDFHMIIHNKIFVQQDIDLQADFLSSIERNLMINVERLQFKDDVELGKAEIEKWLRQKLANRFSAHIPHNLIDPTYTGPRAIIASAAHFRGSWETPFNPEASYRGSFKLDSGKNKDVWFMNMKNTFPYVEDETFGIKMIEIPYYANGASLVLTIPSKRSTPLAEMLQKVSNSVFTSLHMRRRMKLVDLTLPRFFIHNTFDLRTLLNHAGFKEILHDTTELLKFSSEKNLRISEGLHKCAIQVDEDGTFQSDIDYTQQVDDSSPAPPSKQPNEPLPKKITASLPFFSKGKPQTATGPQAEEFKADRPFLVAVRHNKAALFVFSGCVMSP
ncbi:leukocyte elastase inhibitor-like [Paramacrobiotus metropolitanus]|uniref:leukocyte elastase inhibitor-like n=1 Tax=Paramacrobiotus metropolitanus TaxID=2943436 RepID=UPI002446275A|nr:leukocyte elastase inhibitor-like [Paramacrobiotus metropolitanus]